MARPTFFVSSNNTSDCSGTEDNPRDSFPRMLQSTPYRRIYKPSPLARNKVQIEDALSDISSSSSDTLEQSLDVNDILRQVRSRMITHLVLELFCFPSSRCIVNLVTPPKRTIRSTTTLRIEPSNEHSMKWTIKIQYHSSRRSLSLIFHQCWPVVVLFETLVDLLCALDCE